MADGSIRPAFSLQDLNWDRIEYDEHPFTEIRRTTAPAYTYAMANMREADFKEFSALYGDAIHPLMHSVAVDNGTSFTAWHRGFPAFVFGIARLMGAPHLGQAWGFGTDKTLRGLPIMTDFIVQELIPALQADGMRRVEVRVLASHEQSVRWFEDYLDADYETELRNLGRNGESFYQYSWTR